MVTHVFEWAEGRTFVRYLEPCDRIRLPIELREYSGPAWDYTEITSIVPHGDDFRIRCEDPWYELKEGLQVPSTGKHKPDLYEIRYQIILPAYYGLRVKYRVWEQLKPHPMGPGEVAEREHPHHD